MVKSPELPAFKKVKVRLQLIQEKCCDEARMFKKWYKNFTIVILKTKKQNTELITDITLNCYTWLWLGFQNVWLAVNDCVSYNLKGWKAPY